MTDSKKRLWIGIFFNALALLLIGFLVFLIVSKNSTYLESEALLLEEKAKLSSVKTLRNIAEGTEAERDFLSSLFVNKENLIDFIEFVENVGSEAGSKVKVVSVNESKGESSIFIDMKFEITGSWKSVFKTVSLLDHIPYAVSVSGMQITTGDVSEDPKKIEQNWRADLDIRGYRNI